MTVIAMTREIGSHGTDVAAGVAAKLGLEIINSEIVVTDSAGNLGADQNTVQRYLDGKASVFERWRINKTNLSYYTFEQLLRLAHQGNVLIRGWGAAALFRDIPQVISVRVCAPMAVRERVLMERLSVNDVDRVRREIERFDSARTSTMQTLFNINRGDALLYHIVLNTGRVSVDACVKTVCQLAKEPQFQDDAAMRSALDDKLLETRVRATLADNIGAEIGTMTVSAIGGKITIVGATTNGSLPAKAERLARRIEGVTEIDNRIVSVPSRTLRQLE
jgi:cytidylate kinase